MQLVAYYTAHAKGTNIDKPRNKSKICYCGVENFLQKHTTLVSLFIGGFDAGLVHANNRK